MPKHPKKKTLSPTELETQEQARRKKLLSIVGMGSDTATDVAERHDEYIAEAIWEHLKSARRKYLDKKA